MVPTPVLPISAVLVIGVLAFILMMLSCLLLQLKKPKRVGSEALLENATVSLAQIQMVILDKAEEEVVLDKSVMKMLSEITSVLPSLEA